jgi:hypothetical protein
MLAMGDLGETVGASDGAHDHAAAVTAVAAVGPPLGDVLFPPEADAASTAITTFDVKNDAIDEHNGILP